MDEILKKEPCEAYFQIFSQDQKTDGSYKGMYLSPLEFKNTLVKYAARGGESNILDVAQENPNFLSTMPRYAFALLVNVCTALSEQENDINGVGIVPDEKNLHNRLTRLLNKTKRTPESKFLKEALEKMRLCSKINKDQFARKIVTACLGSHYPSPPRVLDIVEPILAEFLDKKVYRPHKTFKKSISVFPTEGASSAIMCIFNTLKYNGLLVQGDTVGVMTPIYSPYLEYPTLQNYGLNQICIHMSDESLWGVSELELMKIANPDMKALLLVNPTNPGGVSLNSHTVRKIASIVRKHNPNIIIITDNTYAQMSQEFNSLFNVLPRNTISIYSFSKYFGASGWRLATIIMHHSNMIDAVLKNASYEVQVRYGLVKTNPSTIRFIDRMVLDSRQVAGGMTAGLSTPQQMLMALFATHQLLDKKDKYAEEIQNLLCTRIDNMMSYLLYDLRPTYMNSNYYVMLDIPKIANNLVGMGSFGDYLNKERDPFEFLVRLAKDYGTVALPGTGFAGKSWSVRVCMANLTDDEYGFVGASIRSLIDKYYEEFKRWDIKRKRDQEMAAILETN